MLSLQGLINIWFDVNNLDSQKKQLEHCVWSFLSKELPILSVLPECLKLGIAKPLGAMVFYPRHIAKRWKVKKFNHMKKITMLDLDWKGIVLG